MADTWYKTEYPYRRKITLSNPTSEVADDSYLIGVDTVTMISDGKCRADCDDIIFCRSDDPTVLTRYILPGSENTSDTSIYVRIKNLSAGTTYIYMYYGSGIAGENQALVEYYKEMKGSIDISGTGGGYYRDIYKTVLATPDGTATAFTVEDGAYLEDSLAVYLRGQQLLKDVDFWETTPSSGLFEFATPPYPGDDIWAEYYADSATPYAPATPYWSTFTADTGSVTADAQADSFNFTGSGGITTRISGKQVIIELATPAVTTDELVKISEDDTTSGYLEDKIVAGDNITVTKNNTGSNETLTIASTASGGGGGAWEIVEYRVVSANCDYVDFTVTGSNYHKFEITLNMINGNTTSAITYYLYLNKDYTNSHYSNQMHYTAINGASLGSWRGAAPYIGGGNSLAPNMQCSSKIDELKRTVNGYADFNYFDRCNYTVGSTGVRVDFGSIYYTQAIDEITDIRIASNLTDGVGAGSEIIIMGLKKS